MNAVVLSVDVELAWGYRDRVEPSVYVEHARTAWSRLLALLDEFDVQATWGVVGHLMLDGCDGYHFGHSTPADGWFDPDPGGSEDRVPFWFGNELVSAVADSNPSHEIAGHTFSNVGFGAEGTAREVAIDEVCANVEVADDAGYTLESFTFSGNSVGHRDVLAAYGFTCYRTTRPRQWYDDTRVPSLAKAVDLTASKTGPPLVEPELDEYGLVALPASMYLFDYEGRIPRLAGRIGRDPLVRAATRGVDRAVRSDEGVFHLWMRPADFGDERDFDRLRTVLSHIDARREETGLSVRTMGEVAAGLRDTDPTTPHTPVGPR